MTINSARTAVAAAMVSKTNTPGMCQAWTRALYNAPAAGDVDGDGDADAVDGWLKEPKAKRHTDKNPPVGAPLAWAGGSGGHGHRAIYIGNGKIRSTDAGGRGVVATVSIDFPETNWHLQYLGWSETIDGQDIPGLVVTPSVPPAPPVETKDQLIARLRRRIRNLKARLARR